MSEDATFTYASVSSTFTSLDDPEALENAAITLSKLAKNLENAASIIGATHTYIDSVKNYVTQCPNQAHHTTQSTTICHCDAFLEKQIHPLASCAQEILSLADKTNRSLSLYSHAENETQKILTALMNAALTIAPITTTRIVGLYGVARQGLSPNSHSSLVGAIAATDELQEPYFNALGNAVSRGRGIDGAAQVLSLPMAEISDFTQGNDVTVQQVHGLKTLPASHTIKDSLKNLQTISEGKTGNSYGTVAIQRYTNSQGVHSWVVIIPGTDGKKDSPFGWPQNVNLMAKSASSRDLADSQGAVLRAMKSAGINEGEKVALVGHSQGGIIAASIASNPSQPYSISHIVTAGSPIANHPIDTSRTWITSVETDKELVSHLDGARNPSCPHWVTVHGDITRKTQENLAGQVPTTSGTRVPQASQKNELSHGMNYHVATYQDAEKLGSDELKSHESHFSHVTEGTLDQTSYFECRVKRSK